MRTLNYFLLLFLLVNSYFVHAQTCYGTLLENIQHENENGDFAAAIKLLKEHRCLDLKDSEKASLQSMLNNLNSEYIALLEKERTRDQKIISSIYFYHNKLALAAKEVDGVIKYGFINKKGETVIDFLYDEAILFDEDISYAKVKKDKKYYYLDTTGREYLLAESVQEMTRETEVLDLSRQGLKELPERLRIFTQLKILNLYDNEFYMLPDWLSELKYLEEIYLGYNMFNEIPEPIYTLKNLVRLDLYDNEIALVPAMIQQLKPLQFLSLSYNPLQNLPKEVEELKYLKELNLLSTPLSNQKEMHSIIQNRLPQCKISW